MKKIIFLGLLVFAVNNCFSQAISKLGFNKINNDIRSIIFSINSEEDFNIITERFNLNEEQAKQLQKVADTYSIRFNLDIEKNVNYMFPYYMESKIDNRLFLTIFVTGNSNYEIKRSQYFFILQCDVGLDKTYNVVFENVHLITDEDNIENWFLKGYKDYLKNTKPIHDLYGYTPPPPPLPPNTLE